MSAKHTPGPWFVDHMEGQMPVGVATADRFPICEMYPGIVGWTAPEPVDLKLANARLIASAPELLDALIQAQSLFQQINRDDGDEFKNLSCDGMDLLEPLIAKATGAQP